MKDFSLIDIQPSTEEDKPQPKPVPKPPPTNPKYSLWRFYNTEGELLYVTIKPNPAILMKEDWWFDTAKSTLEHFSSMDDLHEAKAVAIYNEDPKWNTHGRRTEID